MKIKQIYYNFLKHVHMIRNNYRLYENSFMYEAFLDSNDRTKWRYIRTIKDKIGHYFRGKIFRFKIIIKVLKRLIIPDFDFDFGKQDTPSSLDKII
ncbi:hypothetical protein FACS1894195_1460 [Bacteroidia bacterium]|nr:hypothetical protein FACS1894195_1460 [Bacteroidia bacterium]